MTRTKARQNKNFQKLVGTGGLHPQRDRYMTVERGRLGGLGDRKSPRGFPDSPGEGADLLPGPGGPPGTQGGVSTRKST